jgi:hypothetical protein
VPSLNSEMPAGVVSASREPVDVTTISGPITGDTAFGKSFNIIEDTNSHLHKFHDMIGAEASHYTPEGRKAQLARFSETPAAKALDTAEALADRRVVELTEEAEQAKRDLAREGNPVQANRIWNRTLRIWEGKSGPELAGAVAKSIASASPEELGVLLNETAPYLESRGVSTDFVEPVLEQAAPAYAAKKAKATKGEQARAILRNDLRMVREGIANGAAPRTPLVRPDKYDPDRQITE